MANCCAVCKQPGEYWIEDRATGRKDELCGDHGKPLSKGETATFLAVEGDERMATRGPEIVAAYDRRMLSGGRIPDRTPEQRSGSLVSDRTQERLEQFKEQKLAQEWERTIEEDPWVRMARQQGHGHEL